MDNAQENLAAVLRDSLGAATHPQVAYLNGERHLLVQFDTTAFPDLSDSAFSANAKEIGRLVHRHYELIAYIDSVTVAAHQPLGPGISKIRQQRTYPVAALR